MLFRGYGKRRIPELGLSFPTPKTGEHMTLRSHTPAPTQPGSPGQLSGEARSFRSGEREQGRRGQSAKRTTSSWKAICPRHWGCRHPPQPQQLLPNEPNGETPAPLAQLRAALRPRPRARPTAPPRAGSRRRPTRPPARAKVFPTPRRKDAGPGLPGSSRAYLQGGRGLGLQPRRWAESQTGEGRARNEAGGPLYRPAGESGLSPGPRGKLSPRPGAATALETSSKKTAQKMTEYPNAPDIKGGARIESFKGQQQSAEKQLRSQSRSGSSPRRK
ncbi:hypothetical protein TREES_T100014325 [Tupaia chinensis]|uniref:Uncharacterized protein n=1 Tax=Tupaia chinensis TaxID=246437 RepID=L9JEQ6_TUPCH|nr:hypothetical protein TREES_T100014325 [Tupaia chinensis]